MYFVLAQYNLEGLHHTMCVDADSKPYLTHKCKSVYD